jgi:sortase A
MSAASEATAPPAPVAAPTKRRRVIRRLIRDVSSVLIISGLLLVVDAGVTLIWQEPVTALIGLVKRSQIDKRYLSYRAVPLTRTDRHVLVSLPNYHERMAFLARREQRQVRTGDAIGRIKIPRIGISFDVVQGTDELSLQKGPGHYPETAFPGLGRTVAIAGHRTTYLAPFRHIDALKPGDKILLEMPYGRFMYTVQFHRIVLPTALWVTRNVGYERLVLSACNPLYSAAQRIIIFARLSSEVPTATARAAT